MQPRWLDQWCSGNGVGGYRQLNSCMVICSNPRIGLETVLTLFITTAQFGVPSALISTSSGLIFCMRTLGAAVCFPMCNAIFNSQITKHFPAEVAGAISPLGFPPKDLPAFITALRAGNITAVMEIHGVTTEIINAGQHEQQSAYVGSFCRMWIFPLTLSAVAFIGKCSLAES